MSAESARRPVDVTNSSRKRSPKVNPSGLSAQSSGTNAVTGAWSSSVMLTVWVVAAPSVYPDSGPRVKVMTTVSASSCKASSVMGTSMPAVVAPVVTAAVPLSMA